MIDDSIAALEEEFGTDLGNGVQMIALVYDPYDAPDYICVECGERLEGEELSK